MPLTHSPKWALAGARRTPSDGAFTQTFRKSLNLAGLQGVSCGWERSCAERCDHGPGCAWVSRVSPAGHRGGDRFPNAHFSHRKSAPNAPRPLPYTLTHPRSAQQAPRAPQPARVLSVQGRWMARASRALAQWGTRVHTPSGFGVSWKNS